MRQSGIVVLLILTAVQSVRADDWPQWMGPKRDNIWREGGVLDRFPAGGPKVVWRTPVAGGYAGPAVAGGKLFVTDYATAENAQIENFDQTIAISGKERVFCLNAATGKEIWRHEYPVTYTISYPAGPRCTPTVDGDKVYTLGAEGNLICFKAESGDIVWQKNLPQQYKTETALWGYAGHPLVDGDKLICAAGGDGTHTIAFNKATGEEIWRALSAPAKGQGYSPPTIIEASGKRQLILTMPSGVSSVDPETGDDYWSAPYEATSGSVIMSPILWKNFLYVAGYSKKNLMLELTQDGSKAEVLWRDKAQHGISPINVQPIVVDGRMYGVDENGRLYAVEFPSGRRLWDTTQPISSRPAGNGTAFIVRQGDTGNRFWLFNDSGDLIIAELTPAGYKEIDRAHLIEPTNTAFGRDVVWCMPAFANKHLYVRNDKEIIAVDLAAK